MHSQIEGGVTGVGGGGGGGGREKVGYRVGVHCVDAGCVPPVGVDFAIGRQHEAWGCDGELPGGWDAIDQGGLQWRMGHVVAVVVHW